MIDVTNFAKTLHDKPVAVFGLGLSNRAVVETLTAADVRLVIGDDDPAKADVDLLTEDLSAYACLVAAPGIKPTHPVLQRARAAGLEILCDIEILHRCRHGRRTVGITGTNGKSTTTALVAHILRENNLPCAMGGNIGEPVLALDLPPPKGVIVLELSSYQLALCPTFAPDIAVLLNLTPDHLDYHGGFENYAAAKANIFRGPGMAIVFPDGTIWAEKSERNIEIITTLPAIDNPALRGAHNRQNAAAAFAVCRALGLNNDEIFASIATFPGLAHRQFPVRTIRGIAYINDSKATNAEAAKHALSAFPNIYWIAGGQAKAGGLSGLESNLGAVRHAFLIGAAMEEFALWLRTHGVAYTLCLTLDQALLQAHNKAQSAGAPATVLLSPAAASLDQFRNFEQRGDMFTALVQQLKETST